MTILKIRKHGNSLGIILPRDLIEALGGKEGAELFAVKTPDGIRLTPYDPSFAKTIESARDYVHRHKDAMRALARR